MKKTPGAKQFDKAWAIAVKPDDAKADLEDIHAELTKIAVDLTRHVLSQTWRRKLEKRRTLLEIIAEARAQQIPKFERQAAEYGTPGPKRAVMARNRTLIEAATEKVRQGSTTMTGVIKKLDLEGITNKPGEELSERQIRTILEPLTGKRKPGRPPKTK